MNPDTDEATQRRAAPRQSSGRRLRSALEHMTATVADDGGQQRAGDYWIGYAAGGQELGTHEQPLLWHPMIYHYGRNWTARDDGQYTLRVRVEPPRFIRHDRINGRRFAETIEVEFSDVNVSLARAGPPTRLA